MKRLLIILMLVALILIGFNVGVSKLSYMLTHTKNDKVVQVEITEGSSNGRIAKVLEDNGILLHEIVFEYYLRRNNLNVNMKSGIYNIEPNISLSELARKLEKGSNIVKQEKEKIRVTIPEGYTKEQISNKLEEAGVVTSEEFLSVANSWDGTEWFLKDIPVGENRLEGFLFPDTYYFEDGVDAKTVVSEFLGRFNYVVRNIKEELLNSKVPIKDLVTIASLIEKEAKHNEDRSKISSVIYNRINKDMLLQIDASILYDIGHREVVTNKDLEIDSPYNLYKYKGLPPSPICSPGELSIQASLHPEETDYYYYVVDKDTSYHHFATTYEEHLLNIDKYFKK